jgi:TetR/AcrR family transcriptional regulator, fatty acid metabolism regulator protein
MALRSNKTALKVSPVGAWGAREAGILEVARKLYAARGYERVSMADVAVAAGLAEGTLYNYFRDKTDLVLSVSLVALRANIDEAERIALLAPSLHDGVRDLIAHQLRSMLAAPEMYRIWLREVKAAEGYGRSPARDALRSFSSHFTAFLDRWSTDLDVRTGLDRAVLRDMFYGGIEQIGWTVIVQNRARTFDIDAAALKLASVYLMAFGLAETSMSGKSTKTRSRSAKKSPLSATS